MHFSGLGIIIKIRFTLLVLIILAAGLISVPKARAVAQFSRKYELTCSTCHTAFPRLNYFGEQFMQNGYQMPETEDGNEKGKTKIGDNYQQIADELKYFLGVRLNFDVLKLKTKAQTVTRGGNTDREPKIDVGNANWLQLFTAGSLYKNISIFIETEIEEDQIHNSWFRLGFHNLLGKGGLANIRVGNTSMMDWHVVSGRLRMISNVSTSVTKYNASDGEGEDSVNMSSATPGISFYGYTHGLTYQVGVFNGAERSDPNRFKNYSGTLKYQLQDGDFEGSGISVWGMYGTDTGSVSQDDFDAAWNQYYRDLDFYNANKDMPNFSGSMPTAPTLIINNYADSNLKNNFWRFSPGVNLRFDNNLDLIVAYFIGRDDNYMFQADPTSSGSSSDNDMSGWLAQVGYNITPEFFAAVQYDYVEDEKNTQNSQKLIPSLSYFIKENIRLLLTANIDLLDEESNVPPQYEKMSSSFKKAYRYTRQDEYSINIRAMF